VDKHQTKKRLGQVFIKDKNIIDKIMKFAEITAMDDVVEIGCGEGWLSHRLASEARSLSIIEIDERFLLETKERLSDLNTVDYILADFLKTGFSCVKADRIKLVANIPYYISAKIVQQLVEDRHRLVSALIMVQKEFAKKLVAKPGQSDYTSLAVYTQAHFEVSVAFLISKTSFRPVPKVDSAMLLMTPREWLPEDVDRELFFKMVRSAFWGRRKTYLNCLLESPHVRFSPAIRDCAFFKASPKIRGESLSLDMFLELYRQISADVLTISVESEDIIQSSQHGKGATHHDF
jgi:16S rRNA (adenine1518-N6/adenine1519-N6)-dimethyltransferase